MLVPAALRKGHGDAAGQRHIRFVQRETLARLGNRQQGGGAGSLEREARAGESELVRHPGRQEFLPRPEQHGIAPHLVITRKFVDRGAISEHIVEKIRARTAACEDADGARVTGGVVAGIFQRFPGAFQEQAMLGIGQFGLAGVHPEEGCVEQLDVLQNRPRLDEIGGGASLCVEAVLELGILEAGDGFHPGA